MFSVQELIKLGAHQQSCAKLKSDLDDCDDVDEFVEQISTTYNGDRNKLRPIVIDGSNVAMRWVIRNTYYNNFFDCLSWMTIGHFVKIKKNIGLHHVKRVVMKASVIVNASQVWCQAFICWMVGSWNQKEKNRGIVTHRKEKLVRSSFLITCMKWSDIYYVSITKGDPRMHKKHDTVW